MIMKKTSKKTPFILFVMMMLMLVLSGCFKNQVTSHQGQIRLYLDSEFAQYMPYEEIPDFILMFDGTINTITYSPDTNGIVFASNDDVVFSGIVANLIATYGVITEVVDTKITPTTQINTRDANNNVTSHQYPVDDETIYDEVAFLAFENGLKMTINYRRFVSDGVTYYVWRYSSNITFYLYYPLMVIQENAQKKLLLLALPNRINFQVGSQLKIKNILEKEDYLSEAKYTFGYLEDETIEDPVQYVKDYYITYHQGHEVDDQFIFQYLGIQYKIIFHEQGFTIHYNGTIA
ncbi:MAG: hypothetical protein WCQ80_04775 [Bacilli bacterium]